MATISYQLRPAYASNYGGGLIYVDNFRTYDVKASLTAGSGTITIDAADSPLVMALDGYAALQRSGSSSSATPPATTLIEAVVVRRPSPAVSGYVPILQTDGTWVAGTPAGTSSPTSVAPLNVVRPSISGTTTTGSVLTGDPGTWSGTPTPSYSFRWLRNGAAITSATATTYTLVSADEGQNLTFEVTGSNGVGNPVVVVSTAVVPTASGAPWTPPAGASTPESAILIGPSATYTGGSIDTGVAATRNIDLQSTSDVSGTLSLETSSDQSSWSTAGSTVATSTVNGKQVAGLRRTITTRYYRAKYVNGSTGQLEFSLVRWVS